MDQELQMLNLSDLRPNPHNFRTEFNDPEFDELVDVILKSGADLAGKVPKEILGE